MGSSLPKTGNCLTGLCVCGGQGIERLYGCNLGGLDDVIRKGPQGYAFFFDQCFQPGSILPFRFTQRQNILGGTGGFDNDLQILWQGIEGFEGHGPKNSAFNASTVAVTSARSRNSLRCSQEVSAISRHPWHAAPFSGCEFAVSPQKAERVRPIDKGQPLYKTGYKKMGPHEVETMLLDLGLCFDFRYSYPTGPLIDGGQEGMSERWCTVPPAGRVDDALYGGDGEIIIFVEDEEIREPREQPPAGWNCPKDA